MSSKRAEPSADALRGVATPSEWRMAANHEFEENHEEEEEEEESV